MLLCTALVSKVSLLHCCVQYYSFLLWLLIILVFVSAERMPVPCHVKSVHLCFATLSGMQLQMGDLLVQLVRRNFKSMFGRAHSHKMCVNVHVKGLRAHVCLFYLFTLQWCVFVYLWSMIPLTQSLVVPTGGSFLFLGGCTGGAATHFVDHIKVKEGR